MTAAERRLARGLALTRGLSGRRSNRLVSLSDSSYRYEARPASQEKMDSAAKIIALSKICPRWGYRLVHAIARRQGHKCNHKRVWRLRRELQLSVPRKPSYRRRNGNQNRRMTAVCPSAIWAFDFLHDVCANGQKLKIFAVKDEFTKESLAIVVAGRLRASAVIETLERLVALYGVPAFLRCDNGPEFVARALRRWASQYGIEIAYTDPGKPWQNGSIESFNSRLRDECLNMEWFANREEARVLIEQYRQQYNTFRPHSALNYQTPEMFRRAWQTRADLSKTAAA